MKHIPNIITLANLFFGCIAITFILSSPSYLTTINGEDYHPLLGLEQIYWGSFFILLAAFMDLLDGLAARVLNASSAIGKDLDSLADVVSFGVAPSMILYKLIWFTYMSEPGALDTSIWVTAPAFLIPCFGALRLARYNQTAAEQKNYFKGMPIPAVGLFFASLPLSQWFPSSININFILESRWALYALAVLFSYLMVSDFRFFKWKAASNKISAWWPQIVLILSFIIGFFFMKFSIVPIVILLYILISILTSNQRAKESIESQS